MKNSNIDNHPTSQEELAESVFAKFDDAEEHPERYHAFWITPQAIGYAPMILEGQFVENALVVIKQQDRVVHQKVIDGKIPPSERPDQLYLVYKPDKHMSVAITEKGKESFIKIKNNDPFSREDDTTVFIVIHIEGEIFFLYFTPDEGIFVENRITGTDNQLKTVFNATKRFFGLHSNFRSYARPITEEEEEQ